MVRKQPQVYFRFLDDILIIWTYSEKNFWNSFRFVTFSMSRSNLRWGNARRTFSYIRFPGLFQKDLKNEYKNYTIFKGYSIINSLYED